MKFKRLLLCLFIFSAQSLFAQESFSNFQWLLDKHLVEKKTASGGLDSYFSYQEAFSSKEAMKKVMEQVESLKKAPIQFNKKDDAVAFWINAYNFLMIYKILKDGFKKNKLKIDGVKDFGSLFSPYRAFSTKEYVVGGKKLSLDDIEKKTLLGKEFKKKGWKDARVHFAVNCASVGCSPLRKKIYTAQNVESLLNENTQLAFHSSRHFYLKKKKVYLTHLFKWYKDDFKEEKGSVLKWVISHMKEGPNKEALRKMKKSNIKYIKYDWNLNIKKNF